MANTSATGGYLSALTSFPTGQDLQRFLQTIIVGITELDPTLVRPRWRRNPPQQPAFDVNWCAFGIVKQTQDANAYLRPPKPLDIECRLIRHEDMEILCSFYGPLCLEYAGVLREGLELGQNREQLYQTAMGLRSVSEITRVPELLNDQWFDRADMTIIIAREITRVYQILPFAATEGTIVGNFGDIEISDDFIVTES